MSNIQALLSFQEADVAYDKLEYNLKNSAASKRLAKLRQYLEEQKRILKKITAASEIRRQTIDSTAERFDLYSKRYEDGMEKFERSAKDTPEEMQKFLKYFEQLSARIASERREFTQLVNALEKEDQQLSDMRIKIARARKEYDELKAKVEAEREAAKDELTAAKSKANELETLVDKELLEEYRRVKRNHNVPLAEAVNNKCTGCNMELPAVSSSRLREQVFVECENCGRMVFLRKNL